MASEEECLICDYLSHQCDSRLELLGHNGLDKRNLRLAVLLPSGSQEAKMSIRELYLAIFLGIFSVTLAWAQVDLLGESPSKPVDGRGSNTVSIDLSGLRSSEKMLLLDELMAQRYALELKARSQKMSSASRELPSALADEDESLGETRDAFSILHNLLVQNVNIKPVQNMSARRRANRVQNSDDVVSSTSW